MSFHKKNYSPALKGDIFWSADMFGCDKILISKLGLDKDFRLPIIIPHGIDFYHLTVDTDLYWPEPIYMAFRDDIADRVAKVKYALKFPHPWLLIISEKKMQQGRGTLFIAPPPSRKHFELMLQAIVAGEYSKPWGILIKQRGVKAHDFQWWEERGFSVHTAGNTRDGQFFYKLRDIFAEYECVASPNMSSAVIFAVAMGRRALALPNVRIECVDVFELLDIWILNDTDGKVASVWRNLFSGDQALARWQAENLLGMKYMGEVGELRQRLNSAIEHTADRPIHLHNLEGLLYKICVWLIGKNIPVYKLFPNPLGKICNRLLAQLKLNRLCVYYGSDFSHYGVAGDHEPFRIRRAFAFRLGKSATPGHAVRSDEGGGGRQA